MDPNFLSTPVEHSSCPPSSRISHTHPASLSPSSPRSRSHHPDAPGRRRLPRPGGVPALRPGGGHARNLFEERPGPSPPGPSPWAPWSVDPSGLGSDWPPGKQPLRAWIRGPRIDRCDCRSSSPYMYMSLDHRQVLDCDSRGAVVTLPGPANENSGCATTVTPWAPHASSHLDMSPSVIAYVMLNQFRRLSWIRCLKEYLIFMFVSLHPHLLFEEFRTICWFCDVDSCFSNLQDHD